jgi:hypothetical protein
MPEKQFRVPAFIFNITISVILALTAGILGYVVKHVDELDRRMAEHVALPTHSGAQLIFNALEREIEVMRVSNDAAHSRIELWLKESMKKTP